MQEYVFNVLHHTHIMIFKCWVALIVLQWGGMRVYGLIIEAGKWVGGRGGEGRVVCMKETVHGSPEFSTYV